MEISNLPPELQVYICKFLLPKELREVAYCSRHFFNLIYTHFALEVKVCFLIKKYNSYPVFHEAARMGLIEVLKGIVSYYDSKYDSIARFHVGDITEFYTEHMIEHAANINPKVSNLKVLKWLHSTFNLTEEQVILVFTQAVKVGDLKVLNWLHSTFGIKKKYLDIDQCGEGAICIAVKNDQLKVLQWLYSTFLTKDDLRIQDNYALNTASERDNFEMVQWLHSAINFTDDEIRNCENWPLVCAIENGNLEMVKWICSTFNFTLEDIRHNDEDESYSVAIECAVRNGCLEVLQWLHSTYHFEDIDICASDDLAFRTAAECRQLKVLKWLHSTFNLVAIDEYSFYCNCIDAYKKADLEIATWLETTFNPVGYFNSEF
jgi:hypothetical protein